MNVKEPVVFVSFSGDIQWVLVSATFAFEILSPSLSSTQSSRVAFSPFVAIPHAVKCVTVPI